GRVADGFVNRQPQVRRMKHEIVPPDVHRLRLELLGGFLAPLPGVADKIGREDELPAAPGRLYRVAARLEIAEVGRDRGGRDRHPAADDRLRDDGTVRVGVVAVFANEEEETVHELDVL